MASSPFRGRGAGFTSQRTQYYPSGLPWAEGEGASVQNKKYNGKEFIEAHGLDEYDSQARMYYPAIMRTTTLDPLAEKYYSISPYAWCGNNPVNRIDPDGMSYSNFDRNGNYINTTKDNWWHNLWHGRTGRIVDGDGNVTQSFKFADPKREVKDLKDGKIDKVQFVQESEVISMLSKAGAFTKENKTTNNDVSDRYDYLLKESPAGGKFDFSVTKIPNQYSDYDQTLFLIDGVAHNRFNFGNFMWGA